MFAFYNFQYNAFLFSVERVVVIHTMVENKTNNKFENKMKIK